MGKPLRDKEKAFKRSPASSTVERLNVLPELRVIAKTELAARPDYVNPGIALNRFEGYELRGLWWRDTRYAPLRNAAWWVRESRAGAMQNPAALRLVLHEAMKLVAQGEGLGDVLEAFAELLVHRA